MHWERITDVNLNRLDESLKFIEDTIRFAVEDKALLTRIRQTRNRFLKVKQALPLVDIIGFRKSRDDLGRTAKFDIQNSKTPRDLVNANFARAKEAARVLEEMLKSGDIKLSQRVKEIRFQIYDLEKSVIGYFTRAFNPRVYAIVDETYLPAYRIKDMIDILEKNGATMIQLRIKTLPDRRFYNYAARIENLLKNKATKFIINNRLDIAIASGADGVHLGQDDMRLRSARRILGENYIIGASAHSVEQAKRAEQDGADYIGVGAVYKTKTKRNARVCGLSILRTVCKKVSIPVIGIGGITGRNYKEVLRAGADGIAVSSFLFEGDLRKNIRSLTRGR